jgi:hypothetical protein
MAVSRPGIGTGDFDRCERPLAGETLRSVSELTDSRATGSAGASAGKAAARRDPGREPQL